jgi:hypothetical protein
MFITKVAAPFGTVGSVPRFQVAGGAFVVAKTQGRIAYAANKTMK